MEEGGGRIHRWERKGIQVGLPRVFVEGFFNLIFGGVVAVVVVLCVHVDCVAMAFSSQRHGAEEGEGPDRQGTEGEPSQRGGGGLGVKGRRKREQQQQTEGSPYFILCRDLRQQTHYKGGLNHSLWGGGGAFFTPRSCFPCLPFHPSIHSLFLKN